MFILFIAFIVEVWFCHSLTKTSLKITTRLDTKIMQTSDKKLCKAQLWLRFQLSKPLTKTRPTKYCKKDMFDQIFTGKEKYMKSAINIMHIILGNLFSIGSTDRLIDQQIDTFSGSYYLNFKCIFMYMISKDQRKDVCNLIKPKLAATQWKSENSNGMSFT